jgi:hypothetical protein
MIKLFQTQCPSLPLLVVCALTLCAGCGQGGYSSPEGYELARSKKMELGKVLNEISGLTYNTDDNTLLAISDSKKKIFKIDPVNPKLKDFAQAFYISEKQPDYEDLVKLGNMVYVLISDGTIIAVPAGAKDSSGTRVYPFWSKDKNDFETLYYDPESKGLIILCKSCPSDKGKHVRSAYRFDLETKQFDSSQFYTISSQDIKALLKNDDKEFKPSAAAIHPVSGRLYILSSASNLMVVGDTHGKVIEAFNLNPDEHPQAEGIAFAPNGDMYISNEGKFTKATLRIFPYHKNGTKK